MTPEEIQALVLRQVELLGQCEDALERDRRIAAAQLSALLLSAWHGYFPSVAVIASVSVAARAARATTGPHRRHNAHGGPVMTPHERKLP